ncbi:MAG: protein phosphatase 2C family protein, partial [Sphingobacteriales bacterium]
MKSLILTVLSLAFVSASFAQSPRQMQNRLNEEALHKDILKKQYTLLVKLAFDNKKLVENFRKAMEENYTGKFEIVPYDVKIDDNYADTAKYRFIVASPGALSKKDFTGANAVIANDYKGIAPTSAWSKDFHVVDRTNLSEFWDTNLSGVDHAKILSCSIVKPNDDEMYREDRIRVDAENKMFVVADGAGGQGLFAAEWAQYLIDHLPSDPIKTAPEFSKWHRTVRENFYLEKRKKVEKDMPDLLFKFEKEGSLSTLLVMWYVPKENQTYMLSCGDSVLFLKTKKF